MNYDEARKIDAEVAEWVMGWTRYPEPMHPTDNRTIDGVLYCPPDHPYDRNQMNVVPHYSTEISDAWEIVTKLRDTHLFECEQSGASIFASFIPFVELMDGKVPTSDDGCYAESMPLAIARAALKTVSPIEGK